MRMIECAKLGKMAQGLDKPPFPGATGEYIFEHISQQAWQQWLVAQTMIINEKRLESFDPSARKLLGQEREKFLFGQDFVMPEGYIPKQASN